MAKSKAVGEGAESVIQRLEDGGIANSRTRTAAYIAQSGNA